MGKVHENQGPRSDKFGRTCSRNMRRSRSVGGYFNRLPGEILQNIALMLPFSSIMQLRRSSKFWYNLLTDPKFVDLHLTDALEKPPGYLFTTFSECYFVEQSRGYLSTSKIFEYSFDDFERKMWANFQSSGGLMCVYWSQSYCFRIFNPHIGEEVQVRHDPKFKKFRFLRYIFGYSPSVKEYKILKLGELIEKRQIRMYGGPVTAEICTLGSNIWREIKNVPSWEIDGYIQCQGNPFWMNRSDLHYFDLVSEKFHVIPGPPEHDPVHVTDDHYTCYNFEGGKLISMGHTVGYLSNYRLWELEDKTKGTWINRYDFSIPRFYRRAELIGTSENGHLFGNIGSHPSNFFSHDMGRKGFKVVERNLDEHGSEEQSRIADGLVYIAPHVTSLVSPVSIMKMGKGLNHERKSVLDKLKLDYDATDDDLVHRMYEFLEAYEKDDKSQDS